MQFSHILQTVENDIYVLKTEILCFVKACGRRILLNYCNDYTCEKQQLGKNLLK
jgi:hypothetical protein